MENRRSLSVNLQGFLLAILFVVLALTVLVPTNPGTRRTGRDYGIYLYIGKKIYQGGLPYRDAWENKPPAIFYLNTLGLLIGNGSRWGVWVLEFISLFAAIALSYYLLNKLWGRWPALAGVLLWVAGLDLTLREGNLTEEYPLSLHFASVLLFLSLVESPKHRVSKFLLGLAFGITFLFRPNNAALELSAILILLLLQIANKNFGSIWSHAAWIGLGALMPLALVGLYFWYRGIFYDYIEAAYIYNYIYSATQVSASSPLQHGFRVYGGIAWIAALGYLVAIWQAGRSLHSPSFWFYLFLLLGSLITVFTSDPARRTYDHYYINWLPFIALLAGLAFYFVAAQLKIGAQDTSQWQTAGLGVLGLLAIIFFVSSGRFSEYGRTLEKLAGHSRKGLEFRTQLSIYVRSHTKPDDYVLFWGSELGENIMADRYTPATILIFPGLVKSDLGTKLSDRFLRELETNRPVLIVDTGFPVFLSLDPVERKKQISEGFDERLIPVNADELFGFIDENYYLVTEISERPIYRLRDSSRP